MRNSDFICSTRSVGQVMIFVLESVLKDASMYEPAARQTGKKQNIFYGYVFVAAALLITIVSHGAQHTFGIFSSRF